MVWVIFFMCAVANSTRSSRLERSGWSKNVVCVQLKKKNEICNFCIEVKYLLNFKAFKFCLKKIPENFQGHMVSLPDYLNAIFLNMPFFLIFTNSKKDEYFLR